MTSIRQQKAVVDKPRSEAEKQSIGGKLEFPKSGLLMIKFQRIRAGKSHPYDGRNHRLVGYADTSFDIGIWYA